MKAIRLSMRLSCIAIVIAMSSIRALAFDPWEKACTAECRNNHRYRIVRDCVSCADCGTPVNESAGAIPLLSISSKPAKPSAREKETASPRKYMSLASHNVIFRDSVAEPVYSAERLDVEQERTLYLLRGRDTRYSLHDWLTKPDPESSYDMYQRWVGTTDNTTVFDEFVERVFSNWQGDSEVQTEQRIRLTDIENKFLLPADRIQSVAFQAMAIQDMLAEDTSFDDYQLDKPGFLLKLARYLIDTNMAIFSQEEMIQREVAAVKTSPNTQDSSERIETSDDTDSKTSQVTTMNIDQISHRFSGMQFETKYLEQAKGTCAWDKKENAFISEIGLAQGPIDKFKSILRKGQRHVFSGVNPRLNFKLNIEFYYTSSGLKFNTSSLLQSEEDDSGSDGMQTQTLNSMLNAISKNMMIHISLGDIFLAIRKSANGSYTVYAPLFWSTNINTTQETVDFIRSFLTSLAEFTKETVASDYQLFRSSEKATTAIQERITSSLIPDEVRTRQRIGGLFGTPEVYAFALFTASAMITACSLHASWRK